MRGKVAHDERDRPKLMAVDKRNHRMMVRHSSGGDRYEMHDSRSGGRTGRMPNNYMDRRNSFAYQLQWWLCV